jgi:hypothetical protein
VAFVAPSEIRVATDDNILGIPRWQEIPEVFSKKKEGATARLLLLKREASATAPGFGPTWR